MAGWLLTIAAWGLVGWHREPSPPKPDPEDTWALQWQETYWPRMVDFRITATEAVKRVVVMLEDGGLESCEAQEVDWDWLLWRAGQPFNKWEWQNRFKP